MGGKPAAGLRCQRSDGERKRFGFYTTSYVRAKDKQDAELTAASNASQPYNDEVGVDLFGNALPRDPAMPQVAGLTGPLDRPA